MSGVATGAGISRQTNGREECPACQALSRSVGRARPGLRHTRPPTVSETDGDDGDRRGLAGLSRERHLYREPQHPTPVSSGAGWGFLSLSLRGRHDGICPLALGLAPARIRLPSIKRLLRTSPRLSPSLCMEGLLYASGSRALIFCWSRDYSTTVLGGSESDPVTDSIVYAQSMILIKGGLCVGSPFQNLVFVSPPPPPPPPPPRRRCPSPVLSSSHSL